MWGGAAREWPVEGKGGGSEMGSCINGIYRGGGSWSTTRSLCAVMRLGLDCREVGTIGRRCQFLTYPFLLCCSVLFFSSIFSSHFPFPHFPSQSESYCSIVLQNIPTYRTTRDAPFDFELDPAVPSHEAVGAACPWLGKETPQTLLNTRPRGNTYRPPHNPLHHTHLQSTRRTPHTQHHISLSLSASPCHTCLPPSST